MRHFIKIHVGYKLQLFTNFNFLEEQWLMIFLEKLRRQNQNINNYFILIRTIV